MIRPSVDALHDHVESVRLVDHHVHGFWLRSRRPQAIRERAQRGEHRAPRRLRLRVRQPARVRHPRTLRPAARAAASRRRRHLLGPSHSPRRSRVGPRVPGRSGGVGLARRHRVRRGRGGTRTDVRGFGWRAHAKCYGSRRSPKTRPTRRETTRRPSRSCCTPAQPGSSRPSRYWPIEVDSSVTCPIRRRHACARPPPGGATRGAPA